MVRKIKLLIYKSPTRILDQDSNEPKDDIRLFGFGLLSLAAPLISTGYSALSNLFKASNRESVMVPSIEPLSSANVISPEDELNFTFSDFEKSDVSMDRVAGSQFLSNLETLADDFDIFTSLLSAPLSLATPLINVFKSLRGKKKRRKKRKREKERLQQEKERQQRESNQDTPVSTPNDSLDVHVNVKDVGEEVPPLNCIVTITDTIPTGYQLVGTLEVPINTILPPTSDKKNDDANTFLKLEDIISWNKAPYKIPIDILQKWLGVINKLEMPSSYFSKTGDAALKYALRVIELFRNVISHTWSKRPVIKLENPRKYSIAKQKYAGYVTEYDNDTDDDADYDVDDDAISVTEADFDFASSDDVYDDDIHDRGYNRTGRKAKSKSIIKDLMLTAITMYGSLSMMATFLRSTLSKEMLDKFDNSVGPMLASTKEAVKRLYNKGEKLMANIDKNSSVTNPEQNDADEMDKARTYRDDISDLSNMIKDAYRAIKQIVVAVNNPVLTSAYNSVIKPSFLKHMPANILQAWNTQLELPASTLNPTATTPTSRRARRVRRWKSQS